jgi:hypothetical protein
MVGVGVIEADDVLTALAAFTLDPNQLTRIDVISILRRIGARVSRARRGSYDAYAIIRHATQQHAAAFVRISFLCVLADGFVKIVRDFQHKNNSPQSHRVTEKNHNLNESYENPSSSVPL